MVLGKKRSTLSAIVHFLHDVYNNLNKGKDTYIIYLDFKKAFDTVSHDLLLNKLKKVGLDRDSISWFKSYLKNRKQSTIINNDTSTELSVSYGVPQGSILGPTLFTIYINDMENCVVNDVNFYADDTIIYGTMPNILQSDLTEIYKWCNANLLTLNCKKSQWMKTTIIDRKSEDILFKVGDGRLGKVFEYRYLGVTIDSQLTFQTYRESLINRVNLKVNYFRKIRSYMTQSSVLLLYKCTILPILEYADFIHDFDIKYINKRLQTIQNTCLYIVYNQHRLPFELKDSTETLHRNASLHRLVHRRWSNMLVFIYNYIDDPDLIDVRDIHTKRREGVLFKTNGYDHFKARQDPKMRAMNGWNALPVLIRNARSKEQLKVLLASSDNPYKKIE